MSGGFFRGTSADQDTRFSNKQAKLLKSQKFAPELEHLVDMTKVKMDVIRPWIAKRATELLGFEDEVLINFVYGLLDAKEVDGKQIQIQLTGFMEKNTGKFMKELWGLLLSAQNNVSGVPQQFLDEKEEETRKKKAETDRIAQEIQKRRDRDRDGRELERGRKSRFDGEADISKFTKAVSVPVSKFSKPRTPSVEPDDDWEKDGKHDPKVKDGHSPEHHSTSPPRISPSPNKSNNISFSRSRSYSEGGCKSRSLSVASKSERHSISPGCHSQTPIRRSFSPKKRYRSPMRSISPRRHSPRDIRSPSRRRSPHLRQRSRSRSRSRHRSPASIRYRSPCTRRRSPPRISRSQVHRRSPSPLHRRSPPIRRRSPSPWRRRSPSPLRRRSPVRARRRSPSPISQQSPIRRRSISPARHKSPSPSRRSPLRSPKQRRRSPLYSPTRRVASSPIARKKKRSHSPYRSQSPRRLTRRSLSRERASRVNGSEPRQYQDEQTSQRFSSKRLLVNHVSERQISERADSRQKASESVSAKLSVSLCSPQRDFDNLSSRPESPTYMLKINRKINRRSHSLSKSPVKRASVRVLHESPSTIIDEGQMTRARDVAHHRTDSSRRRKNLPKDVGPRKPNATTFSPESFSPDRRTSDQSPGRRVHTELKMASGYRSDVSLPERNIHQLPYLPEKTECGPGREREERGSPGSAYDRQRSTKLHARDEPALDRMGDNKHTVDNKRQNKLGDDNYIECHHEKEFTAELKKKISKGDRLDRGGSDSEEPDSYGNQNKEKRRHKKSDKRKRDYYESSESDSEIEDKKESKRRRKDEKRLRKEEKRRRREERHHRKFERRAGKLKLKSVDTFAPPSDSEKDHSDATNSDGDAGSKKNSHPNDVDETESEQKKLEIELREKALESLRAKKAISH